MNNRTASDAATRDGCGQAVIHPAPFAVKFI